MKRIDTLIIGGGQAGLSMSRALDELAIDHLVLERGRIVERWRRESWDSLRLQTPNWMTRLPGQDYTGSDPDGFMTAPELVAYLEQYAAHISAPVREFTEVLSVRHLGSEFRVPTDGGTYFANRVVMATGQCGSPNVPEFATRLDPGVEQLAPNRYKNPGSLPDGGVLVVGASATGVQLAEEIQGSGRQVTLAVGPHSRVLRSYRGKDIMWWLDRMGIWNRAVKTGAARTAQEHEPSLQLVGSPELRNIDLNTLSDLGVRVVGRALDAEAGRVAFSADLAEQVSAADERLESLLDRFDYYAAALRLDGLSEPRRFDKVKVGVTPTELDLHAEGIRTVIWATGYRPRYPWLHVPEAFGENGGLRHQGGITRVPGLYVLGLQFLRHRNSSTLSGVGLDAQALARHMARSVRHKAA